MQKGQKLEGREDSYEIYILSEHHHDLKQDSKHI